VFLPWSSCLVGQPPAPWRAPFSKGEFARSESGHSPSGQAKKYPARRITFRNRVPSSPSLDSVLGRLKEDDQERIQSQRLDQHQAQQQCKANGRCSAWIASQAF